MKDPHDDLRNKKGMGDTERLSRYSFMAIAWSALELLRSDPRLGLAYR